jgi:MFS family permease
MNSLSRNVGWYGAAYQLASGALQPLTGKLYVNFKNKWVFISFFALFELGSLICGVAPSSNVLIVGRAIQGMGTAGLQNGAFTIISAAVPLVQRPGLIGACQGIAQLGAVIGPLVGGALTQYST